MEVGPTAGEGEGSGTPPRAGSMGNDVLGESIDGDPNSAVSMGG